MKESEAKFDYDQGYIERETRDTVKEIEILQKCLNIMAEKQVKKEAAQAELNSQL